MDFSEALRAVKGGARIARTGWNGDGMFVPRVITQSDALADDWERV